MVPDQLRLIPVFVMLTNWHLINSFSGYILISMVTATNLFFMRQYFLTIPKDYEEAAKLDGAGYFKTFWRIMLPLAAPAIAALTILQFQGTWNDFFWPLILFGQGNHAPLYRAARPRRAAVQLRLPCGPRSWPASVLAIAPILSIFHRLPTVLRVGRRLLRGEGMTSPGHALGLAFVDLYRNSWRLLPINAALGALLVAISLATLAVHAALVLIVLAGPVARGSRAQRRHARSHRQPCLCGHRDGLRLHWRRGLALGAGGATLVLSACSQFGSTVGRRYSFPSRFSPSISS